MEKKKELLNSSALPRRNRPFLWLFLPDLCAFWAGKILLAAKYKLDL